MLTKSKYIAGLQCYKLLWYQVNEKRSIPAPDEAQQKIFDVGTNVGVLATKLFPEGIKVSEDGFLENIKDTQKLLSEGKPLFEAGFMTSGLFSRADILVPDGDSWDIFEVKSSTSVSDVHVHDLSFQKHVYEKCGLKIGKCYLMYINTSYVKNGELELGKLFAVEDVTEKVDRASVDITKRIDEMRKVIAETKPDVDIGPYCDKPYKCAMHDICWAKIPKGSVFELYYGGKKSWELYHLGILSIKDIPLDYKLNEKQSIQRSGEIRIDKAGISKFVNSLSYPIYHLDFETMNPCIPMYDGMKPYSRIAFQYSLHVEKEDGTFVHKSFLAEPGKDPRLDILSSLKENLGSVGTILAWNMSFEVGVIKELISYHESYKEWGESVLGRFSDLMTPFKDFSYYNPLQAGSVSIKNVLPAMTDVTYSNLEINNGGDASNAYERLCTSRVSEDEKTKVMQALEKYCEMDTWAEMVILGVLREMD